MPQMLIADPIAVDAEFLQIVADLGAIEDAEPAQVQAKARPFSDEPSPREENIEPWEDEDAADDVGIDWP